MNITRIGLAAVLCLASATVWAERPACGGHGGAVRFRKAEAVCKDGSIDKRPSAVKKAREHRPLVRTIKFKAPPDRGQILSPGEEPPTDPDLR